MQYELNLDTYQKKIDFRSLIKTEAAQLITIFMVGMFLGRVVLFLNIKDTKGFAPFGLAFIMAVFYVGKKKSNYFTSCAGVLAGYISIRNVISDLYMYIILLVWITAVILLFKEKNKKYVEYINVLTAAVIFFICGMFVSKYDIGIDAVLCGIQIITLVPVYYIIKYALNALEDMKVNIVVSTEETASMAILLCLIIAGIGNISIFQYSIRNILALAVTFVIAYIGGASYGAMIGVSMGIILGISTNNMEMGVAFYGVGGLVVGVFKDTGKILSILAGIIIYFILGLYSNQLDLKLISEVIIGACIFLMVPKSACKSIEIEINPNRRKTIISNNNLNDIKEEFSLKVRGLTDVLNTISECLDEKVSNKNLSLKNSGSALVESLADRSCSQCINRNQCWEKEFHQTYVSFQTLINNYQDGEFKMPDELEKKCVKHLSITKNTATVVKNYNSNEMVLNQLLIGRKIMSQHIKNISCTLDKILDKFNKKITICDDMEKIIKRGLNKNNIRYNEVFCYTDYEGRMKIKIGMNNCSGCNYCGNNVLPVLKRIMKIPLSISSEGCVINPSTSECTITIEETPKYYMRSYAAIAIKNGEDQTGDYYSFGKTIDGYYTFILSDGMGSGCEASEQSKSTVNIAEHLTEAGFGSNLIVDTINSIMSAKFSESEKFATLDLGKVDLYNGNISFIKMGAAPSFIKSNGEVKKIVSNNLPFGIVDEVEVEVVKDTLKPGDVVVSVSDGILDIDKSNAGDDTWIEKYLKDNNNDPMKLSQNILNKAKELSKELIKDDMTVIVSKVYCVS